MTAEIDQSPDQADRESRREGAWIEENRALFWLAATTAYEEYGPGALLVDLINEPVHGGHPFSYYTEGELELEDEELARHLDEYDPAHEFILVLLKPGTEISVHLGRGPDLGWETELTTLTRYGRQDPVGR
jgi:hypothetical protein